MFSGWATTPNGGVAYKDGENILTYYDNVDLYAVRNEKTCYVTFKAEDEEVDIRAYSIISPCGTSLPVTVKKNCDFNVKIPMKGKITSLNASVSAGIVIYEAVKQRM